MFAAIVVLAVAFWFFRSPLPGAMADSVRRKAPGPDPRTELALAQLSEDVNALRESVMELAERVDFAERALIEVRRRDELPSPRS
jgi:hypothetical protein